MVQDPYKVLGVSRGTSDAEITKAYRKLVKKYHPDLHPGNKEAERKMIEINDAYDQIKNGTADQNYYQSYSQNYNSNEYKGYYTKNSYRDNTQNKYTHNTRNQHTNNWNNMYEVANHFINIGAYREALYILSQIKGRNAKWYYMSAIANHRIGNRITALEHAKIAVQMEPNSGTYQALLNHILQSGKEYSYQSVSYGKPLDMENLCIWCCICNSCCFRICC